MRIIDADALKDNMFHYAAPEMVWDRGDIEHKINEMPTIDAIPVGWLTQWRDKLRTMGDYQQECADSVDFVMLLWKKEQEGQNVSGGNGNA